MAVETKFKSIPGKMASPRGRVCFARGVFEPKMMNGEPRYGMMIVYNLDEVKKDERFQAMKSLLDEVAQQRFEVEGYKSKVKGKPLDTPFFTNENYDFIEEGEVGVRFNTKYKPEIVDADGETYLTDENEFYSGCLARVTYAATAYEVEGSRGVKFQLNAAQKVGAGTRFKGSRLPATDQFEAVEPEVADIHSDSAGSEEQDF